MEVRGVSVRCRDCRPRLGRMDGVKVGMKHGDKGGRLAKMREI